jgi:hypothetical protein
MIGKVRAAADRQHERRFTGFDDEFLALYVRGMRVTELQAFCPRCMPWRSHRIFSSP